MPGPASEVASISAAMVSSDFARAWPVIFSASAWPSTGFAMARRPISRWPRTSATFGMPLAADGFGFGFAAAGTGWRRMSMRFAVRSLMSIMRCRSENGDQRRTASSITRYRPLRSAIAMRRAAIYFGKWPARPVILTVPPESALISCVAKLRPAPVFSAMSSARTARTGRAIRMATIHRMTLKTRRIRRPVRDRYRRRRRNCRVRG